VLVLRGDISNAPLDAWRRALEKTAPISRNSALTLPLLIDDLAGRFDGASALLSDEGSVSYRGLAERCNRYAGWACAQGLTEGKVVCLLMPNSPDYMAIWLGVTRVGGIVALVNTSLVGSQLAHAIGIVAPAAIIVAAECAESVAAVLPDLGRGIRCWAHGPNGQGFTRLDDLIERGAGDRLTGSEYRPPLISDQALYIYTSGTTGLPKAAKVSHFRLMQWTHWFAGMMDTRPTDRMYLCLPMYHSIGGVTAPGAMLVNGGSVLLRRRFSASRFWDEVIEGNCTVFQYIGELCRYLVNAPPHPRERQHRLRLCCGNGLRSEVWREFEQRFQVPQIVEFYAATEGNFSLYNCEGKPGAIGRVPAFLAHRFPMALIKCHPDTGEPVRNDKGFCIRCTTNEVGEAIGKIDDGSRSGSQFEGYTDQEATDKKILRDVFAQGDAWFCSGDLMRKDEGGYFYFVDRVGDTFRWKGENVSTTEVAEAISTCPGVIEAVVYGVTIPGTEGRAGMAAVVFSRGFHAATFRQHLVERLPEYARPLFLRICEEIEITATFKQRKQVLSREGYDPAAITDPLYFNDRERAAFVTLDRALYERICRGELRL
jgi:fatty-acyl-CoA synthase